MSDLAPDQQNPMASDSTHGGADKRADQQPESPPSDPTCHKQADGPEEEDLLEMAAANPEETANAANQPPSTPDSPDLAHPPDVAALLQGLNAGSVQMMQMVEALQASFDARIRYDQAKEQMLERLHQEVQHHRSKLLLQAIRPLLLDLIRLYDDMGGVFTRLRSQLPPGEPPAQMLETCETFRMTVEDILYRYGVETYSIDPPTFNPRNQRALRRVETADEALHLQVAERLRMGFKYQEEILRPELVAVYAYVAAPQASPQTQQEEAE